MPTNEELRTLLLLQVDLQCCQHRQYFLTRYPPGAHDQPHANGRGFLLPGNARVAGIGARKEAFLPPGASAGPYGKNDGTIVYHPEYPGPEWNSLGPAVGPCDDYALGIATRAISTKSGLIFMPGEHVLYDARPHAGYADDRTRGYTWVWSLRTRVNTSVPVASVRPAEAPLHAVEDPEPLNTDARTASARQTHLFLRG